MHIVVCVKEVLDPEIPASAFGVDDTGRAPQVIGAAAARVLDSYAENALEAGIQLRDRTGGRLTALCVGGESADDVLRRALAFTANAAVRVWDPAWTELDGQGVAHLLARAVAVLGGADLILCGRQASDLEQGLVGPMLAEELGMPCVTVGRRITVHEESVRVEREVDGLVESVEVTLPAVVTMTSAKSNVPRMPKVKDVMLARGKLIRVLGAAELGVEPGWVGARVRVERLRVPVTAGRCEMLAGEEAGAQAAALVDRLRALKVI